MVFAEAEDLVNRNGLVAETERATPVAVELLKLAGDDAQLEVLTAPSEWSELQGGPPAGCLDLPRLHQISSVSCEVRPPKTNGFSVEPERVFVVSVWLMCEVVGQVESHQSAIGLVKSKTGPVPPGVSWIVGFVDVGEGGTILGRECVLMPVQLDGSLHG